jgi:hypothetical protein
VLERTSEFNRLAFNPSLSRGASLPSSFSTPSRCFTAIIRKCTSAQKIAFGRSSLASRGLRRRRSCSARTPATAQNWPEHARLDSKSQPPNEAQSTASNSDPASSTGTLGPVSMPARGDETWSRPSGQRSPILARPPARTPAAALLATHRRSQGVEAGPRYRCCPDRDEMARIDRSSTPHKPQPVAPPINSKC